MLFECFFLFSDQVKARLAYFLLNTSLSMRNFSFLLSFKVISTRLAVKSMFVVAVTITSVNKQFHTLLSVVALRYPQTICSNLSVNFVKVI